MFLFGYVGLVGDGGLSFGGFCSVVGVLCVSMLGLVSVVGFGLFVAFGRSCWFVVSFGLGWWWVWGGYLPLLSVLGSFDGFCLLLDLVVAFRWFGWIRFSALLLYFSGGYFGPAWPILLRCFVGGFGRVCCTGCGFLPRLLDLRCVGVVCIVFCDFGLLCGGFLVGCFWCLFGV